MRFFSQRLREAKGFTLVELMVVVAIIGVLSAVAIPNFRKYQAKSKTSEAKLQLASSYTAEVSFLSDFDSYGACLSYMGYNPANESITRFYTVGISGSFPAAALSAMQSNGALLGAGACVTVQTSNGSFFPGLKPVGSTAQPMQANTSLLLADAIETGFTVQAMGALDKNFVAITNADSWTIDNTKAVKQMRVGY